MITSSGDMSISPRTEWAPAELTRWLVDEGRLIAELEQFTTELGQRLLRLGVPLMRMRVSVRTLNPQTIGKAYTWWRDRPKIEIYSPTHSITSSADYLGSPIESVQNTGQPFRCRLALADQDTLHSSLQTLHEEGATDYIAIPLRFSQDKKPSTWILTTDHPQGFSEADLSGFAEISRLLAPILEVFALRLTTQSLLDTYLGPRTGRKVFSGQVKRGDGELIEAVIWYCDMRDSTAITESLNHQQLLKLLNQYFEIINAAVTEHGGEVLRFIGDAMLVVFPSGSRSLKEASEAALRAARTAHENVNKVNPSLTKQGFPAIRYGLGLDVGEVIYGNIGAPNRLDFTVMGAAVNRAARIENLTKQTGCSTLVSETFAKLLPTRVQFEGDFYVAGVERALKVYSLDKELD
ncbi:MAG: adenylate/guanylate cyclase domain-containing protein [Halopseudomonas sp.]